MIRLVIIPAVCASIAVGGCRTTEKAAPVEASSQPAKSAVPDEMRAVAETALGSGTEVLAFGDLAQNGRLQALVINGWKAGPLRNQIERPETGVRVTRAVVIEQEQEKGKWIEVLRCDEYLKNPRGFLEGTPRAPVTGWELRMTRQNGKEGAVRDLYFTPLGRPASEQTVDVRWNPKAARYQSRGKDGVFFGEIVSLEIPGSELR